MLAHHVQVVGDEDRGQPALALEVQKQAHLRLDRLVEGETARRSNQHLGRGQQRAMSRAGADRRQLVRIARARSCAGSRPTRSRRFARLAPGRARARARTRGPKAMASISRSSRIEQAIAVWTPSAPWRRNPESGISVPATRPVNRTLPLSGASNWTRSRRSWTAAAVSPTTPRGLALPMPKGDVVDGPHHLALRPQRRP